MDETTKVIGDLRRDNNRLRLLLIGQNKLEAEETKVKIAKNIVSIKKLKQAQATT